MLALIGSAFFYVFNALVDVAKIAAGIFCAHLLIEHFGDIFKKKG